MLFAIDIYVRLQVRAILLEVRHIIRAAWFACDRALIKRAAGVKNRHNTCRLSLAVSGFILASGLFLAL